MMAHTLTPIDTIIAQDFEEQYTDDEFIQDWYNAEDAIEYFEADFQERYNSDNVYVDLQEITQLLTYKRMMLMCECVANHFQSEYDMQIDASYFSDDKMLKCYIYTYLYENQKNEFINKIEQHFNGANPQEGGSDDEEAKETTT